MLFRMLNLLLSLFLIFPLSLSSQTLPDNMYADTLHAPFLYGVASGDPTPDRVILWTHFSPDSMTALSTTLNWEVAPDTAFSQVTASGTVKAGSSTGWTAKVDAAGLQPASTYYYRFQDSLGNYSLIGRTKTAPSGPASQLKFAVTSCSSIYSGYFNGYRRMAERDDIDLWIHLGDYIYDFIDPDEEIRIPNPRHSRPNGTQGWRDRHAYYCLDPDLRAARQMHPLVAIWDNHDVNRNQKDSSARAFLDWVPVRENTTDFKIIYRHLKYGDLVDLIMLDNWVWRGDSIAPGEESILGQTQYNWFLNRLDSATATWKVIGHEKMFSTWGLTTLQAIFPTQNGVFSSNTWDGFQLERDRVLEHIETNQIDNVVMLSGDSHLSMAMDLSRESTNSALYDPATGRGSLGVEFMPPSITRGNFDEAGFPSFLTPVLIQGSILENPHQQYIELVQHGYGLLTITPDTTTAQWWFSEILSQTSQETMDQEMTVVRGDNHWNRNMTAISPGNSGLQGIKLFPNPADQEIRFELPKTGNSNIQVRLYNLPELKEIRQLEINSSGNQAGKRGTISLEGLPNGAYFLLLTDGKQHYGGKFIRSSNR